ncbi:MAG: DUF3566 domain-containing protein [Acidimicrobiia bacterium]|nr:DUF3566 domain-containing protein [Acidimicrobiia bacterium]
MDPAATVAKTSTGADPATDAKGKLVGKKTPVAESNPEPRLETSTGGGRRSRVEMTRVDLWSVLKVSLCFYLAGLVILILAGLVIWLLLDASGGIKNFESFMGDILGAKDYHLVAPQLLLGSVLVGLVLVALISIVTVIAAALYNVFSDMVGGVEVTFVEAE